MDKRCENEFYNWTLYSDAENFSFPYEPYPADPTFWRTLHYVDYIKIIAYIVIVIGGLLGNFSVVLTVACNRSMRTTINFYVANLAVADAMICVICMLPSILSVITGDIYILGEFMCKFNPFTQNAENFSFPYEPYPADPTFWRTLHYVDYIKIIAYIVIVIGGLLGNFSVVLTVACNRSMRTTINFYVANLAVADAMICVICMLPSILSVITGDIYILGEFMCKFNPFTQMTCLTCSVLTLSAISCDRFIAIMFPLHVRITKQRTSVVMSVIWIVSIIVSIPLLIVKKYIVVEWQDFNEPRCNEEWPLDMYYEEVIEDCAFYEPLRVIYYMVVSLTLFFLPIIIMVIAYSLILWKLWVVEVPGEQHAANINVHSRARRKVVKMVFVVLVVFIICWTPLQIVVLYSAFGHNAPIHGELPAWFPDFKWFSYYIAYANSFMNPIIYGGFNKTFREGFCILLRCGFPRERFNRPARSRMTFTTGVTSSPSRNASKTVNGSKKFPKHTMEMKSAYQVNNREISGSIKETCISISDVKENEEFT